MRQTLQGILLSEQRLCPMPQACLVLEVSAMLPLPHLRMNLAIVPHLQKRVKLGGSEDTIFNAGRVSNTKHFKVM